MADRATTLTTVPDPFDRIVFDGGLVRVGAFRCRREHPSFHDTGPIQNYCFVFPRTAVEIQHEHEPAFVSNTNVVTFYNKGQVYRRNAISPEGDLCDWFGVDPELVRDVVREFDPRVDNRPEQPFVLTRGWSDAPTYLLQRQLFTLLASDSAVKPLAVEEIAVELLERVLRSTYAERAALLSEITAHQRDTVHNIETILSRPADERVTLGSIAREVGRSAYYICHLFRQVTGKRLYRYRLQFRLRNALSEVVGSARPLTDIALDAGFSSHSRFTECFRREFGEVPSAVRALHPRRLSRRNPRIRSTSL